MKVQILKSLALVLAVTWLAGCQKPDAITPAPAPSPDGTVEPTHAQPKLPTMKIYLGAETLDAEMAVTPQEERTGMMFRTNIQDADAMLFNLYYPMQASFWMKNCPESISAAYITPDGTIAEIHHFEHDDTNAVLSATANIQYVLETQEGWFTHHHIGVGTVIRTDKGSLAETFQQRH